MRVEVFDAYRQNLEQRFLQQGHANLEHHFTADLAQVLYTHYHRRAIRSLSAYLPFDQQLIGNPYQMQGGGDYYLTEVELSNELKAIIHIHHIYEHVGALPRPQKHGRLVDLMIRLHYLKTLPQYEGARTYMVLISDHVMINYQGGFAFQEKQITSDWVAGQVNAFQGAIVQQFQNHLQNTGIIAATHYTPVYTNQARTFGMGVWQIH